MTRDELVAALQEGRWEIYGLKPERWMLKASEGSLAGFMLAIVVRQFPIGWRWRTSWGGRGRWALTRAQAQSRAARAAFLQSLTGTTTR